MKNSTYKIWFENCVGDLQFELVGATHVGAAIILAQAIRIRNGRDYTVASVELIEE